MPCSISSFNYANQTRLLKFMDSSGTQNLSKGKSVEQMMDSRVFNNNFNGVFDDVKQENDPKLQCLDQPPSNLLAGLSSSMCDNFLNFIKSIDFPLENLEENNDVGQDWDPKQQCLDQPPSDVLAGFSYGLCGNFFNGAQEPMETCFVSNDENSQQMPIVAKDTSGGSICPLTDSSDIKDAHPLETSSPISVIESNSTSTSSENLTPIDPKFIIPVTRARGKRAHPSIVNPWHQISFTISGSSTRTLRSTASKSSLNEKVSDPVKRKQDLSIRKCSHCEVTKTPQWREGPMGPNTLCNACGVRYMSGRLHPQYRPAASPTFNPSLHSNFRKKVTEMRRKQGQIDHEQ